jgi:Ice-binding-like
MRIRNHMKPVRRSSMKSVTVRALGQRARIARIIVAVAFAGVFAAACKSSTEPGLTATIAIAPTSVTLAPGGTQQFTVIAKNADGDILAIPNPIWAVSGGGGTISSTGLYTAGTTAGTFTNSVSVTCNGVTASATVIITAGPLTTITVTPNPTLLIGATQQFTAVGHDANGNVVAITPVWSTVNPPGTIVSTSGLFTAGNTTGTFPNSVRATSGTIFGTATVTVIAAPPPSFVNLGAANSMGILAGSTITCVTGGTINADIGLSPGSSVVLGTPPCVVTGTQHITDAVAAQAQLDLTTAYNTLAGLPCGTVIGTADIGGTTRTAGVYCSASTIGVTGTLTLDGGGDPNAVFVFQAGSGLTGVGTISLIGGAQAKNVYWQVGSSAVIGVGSAWKGNILSFSSITLNDNTTLIGRALARNGAVTLGTGDTITLP